MFWTEELFILSLLIFWVIEMNRRILLSLTFILIFSLLLFHNFLDIYFFQDDFFMLSISRIHSVFSFLRFFVPRSDVQFYRPLSHELFFFVNRALFGFNPYLFHIVPSVFFLFNIVLVYLLSGKLLRSRRLGLITAFFYSTSAVHYNSLFWIANFSYIEVTFFYFFGFYYVLSNFKKKYLALPLIFVAGLLSNEFMITFPLILLVYLILFQKTKIKTYFPVFFWFFVITVAYMILRFVLYKPDVGSYKYTFDKSIISSYRWFLLFALNWAETMKDQMISFYKVRPDFLKSFSREYYGFIINLFTILTGTIIIPLLLLIKNKTSINLSSKNMKLRNFALLWFLITLLPIIFVPSHISPHQGSIALFGLLLFFFSFLESLKNMVSNGRFVFLMIVMSGVWVYSSSLTITLANRVHWIYRRSIIARDWIDKTHRLYPTLPKNTNVILYTANYETQVALSSGKGISESYNDPTMKIYFSTSSAKLKNAKFVP